IMLQPHSFLWHYLWLAPCLLLAILACLMARRGLHKDFPAFFGYIIFEAAGGATVYAIDICPSFSAAAYWRSYLLFLIAEVVLKFVVIGELFTHFLRRYPSLGGLAKTLLGGVGILLGVTAIIIAAYANSTAFWLISATRVLGRSASVVQCWLIVFLFLFAARFHLKWEHSVLGIALGFGVVASVYLAYWALMAEWLLGQKSYLLDFLNATTYHVCVLIWFYYLLVPQKCPTTSAVFLPEHNLELWNRELERLLQR
ncbi:MAG: hypothetical protein WCB59_20475, partial [Candidatus Sulfotelmatobacter sp.]